MEVSRGSDGGDTHNENSVGGGGSGSTAALATAAAPEFASAAAISSAETAPAATSAATILLGGVLSSVRAATLDRASGLRRRASRAIATATAAPSMSVRGGDMGAAGADGTTKEASDKGVREETSAEAGGEQQRVAGSGMTKEDKNEQDEPKISWMRTLWVAAPWFLPRKPSIRALLAVALTAEVAGTVCRVTSPLLLRYAIQGLTRSAASATATAAEAASSRTDDAVASGVASSRVPAAVTKSLLLLLPRRFTSSASYQRPLVAVVGYLGSRYLGHTLSNVRRLSWARAERALTRDVQIATFAHLHSLSYTWHLNRNTGLMMHVFNLGVRSVTELLELVSFSFFPILANLSMNQVVLWRLGTWQLSGLAALAVSSYAAFTFVGTHLQMQLQKKAAKATAREAGRAMDSLLNYENVKLFATEAVEVQRYSELLGRRGERRNLSHVASAFLYNGQSLIQTVFVAVGMVMVGRQVMDGTRSIADFMTAHTYLNRIFEPFTYMTHSVHRFFPSLRSLRKLVHIRLQCPDVLDAPDASPLVLQPTPTCKGGRVCFDRVCFAYGANSAGAVHDISFTVPAGKTTAIVGPTGSGKSTLLRLLLRLFNVSTGCITIDGQDVASVTQQSLRNAIGIVPQDCYLFRDSIRANIAYGRSGGDGVSDDAVEAAVKVAQLGDWVERLPNGLSSICGERGVLLSGGERQRVAIARMVVREPAVVVLDECSSSLDSETERAMQSALRVASTGATTLIIAHRLSTVVTADEILVLFNGRIVERGTHKTLLRIDGGHYQRMWKLQHGEDGTDTTGGAATTDGAAPPARAPGASCAPGVDAAATAGAPANGGAPAADGGSDGKGTEEVAVTGETTIAIGGVPVDSVAVAAKDEEGGGRAGVVTGRT